MPFAVSAPQANTSPCSSTSSRAPSCRWPLAAKPLPSGSPVRPSRQPRRALDPELKQWFQALGIGDLSGLQRAPATAFSSGLGIRFHTLATSTAPGQWREGRAQPGAAASTAGRATASRGRVHAPGSRVPGIGPLASTTQLASRVFNPPSMLHLPVVTAGEAPQAGPRPHGRRVPGLRVGHRFAESPHGFKRIQLAVPGGEQAQNKAPAAAMGGVRRRSCCLDREFRGQACLLAFGANVFAANLLLGCCGPAATGRPGTTGPALGCQIRRPSGARDQGIADCIARPGRLAPMEDIAHEHPDGRHLLAAACGLGPGCLPVHEVSRHSQALQPPTAGQGRPMPAPDDAARGHGATVADHHANRLARLAQEMRRPCSTSP